MGGEGRNKETSQTVVVKKRDEGCLSQVAAGELVRNGQILGMLQRQSQ